MKSIISIAALSILFFMASCTGKKGESFGEKITEDGSIPASELVSYMKGKDSAEVKVKATIKECCQKKGCWMDVELGNGEIMTVKFKDYAFFVPKDAAGKTTIIEGVVRKEVADVEWLKHKAQDAGKSQEEIDAITSPEESYSFEAKGVIIR